jgi:hypothetical protein
MEYVGVGSITGLYGVYGVQNAVILDSGQAFDNIKKGLERVTSEKSGLYGIRSIAGKQGGMPLIVVNVPPYPQAIVEAVSELYMFGVRRIIGIGRGFRLVGRLPARAVLVARGAVGMDGISESIAGGLPLIVSSKLESIFRSVAEIRFSDFNWVYGFTLTVPSPYMRSLVEKVRSLAGKRAVVAVDSYTAALYAMQYEYPHLEALGLIVLPGQYEKIMEGTIMKSIDEMEQLRSVIARSETILYMVAIEILKKLG